MSKTSIYLNFVDKTEEAFHFYRSVFGTEFIAPMTRMSESGAPNLSARDSNLIMNVQLPILGGVMLMGTDSSESMGFNLVKGDNMHINLEPDTMKEGTKLFELLSDGGKVGMPL